MIFVGHYKFPKGVSVCVCVCVCVSVCEPCGGLAIHSRHISSSPPATAEDKQYGKWMDGH